jgi:hypothetical protein
MGSTLNEYACDETAEQADENAILSDWSAVGDSLCGISHQKKNLRLIYFNKRIIKGRYLHRKCWRDIIRLSLALRKE